MLLIQKSFFDTQRGCYDAEKVNELYGNESELPLSKFRKEDKVWAINNIFDLTPEQQAAALNDEDWSVREAAKNKYA